jgi:hypothetical protein
MKKFFYPMMLIAFTLLLTNCKKTEDDEQKKQSVFGADGTWTATLNGITHEGAFSSCTYQDNSLILMSLTGESGNDGEKISLSFNDPANKPIKQGTTYSFRGVYTKDGVTYLTEAPDFGTVTLTKFDETNNLMSGTYSFKGRKNLNSDVDAVTVTNGQFVNVTFIVD